VTRLISARGLLTRGSSSKTDKIDAVLLARYGCLAQPKAWTPPAERLIQLQALLARLDDLEGDLRREQNRYEMAARRTGRRS